MVGIRYCGGCNPRFDRVQAVQELKTMLPNVSFVHAGDGTPYHAAVVVGGCASHCAHTEDLTVPADCIVHLMDQKSIASVALNLQQLLGLPAKGETMP